MDVIDLFAPVSSMTGRPRTRSEATPLAPCESMKEAKQAKGSTEKE